MHMYVVPDIRNNWIQYICGMYYVIYCNIGQTYWFRALFFSFRGGRFSYWVLGEMNLWSGFRGQGGLFSDLVRGVNIFWKKSGKHPISQLSMNTTWYGFLPCLVGGCILLPIIEQIWLYISSWFTAFYSCNIQNHAHIRVILLLMKDLVTTFKVAGEWCRDPHDQFWGKGCSIQNWWGDKIFRIFETPIPKNEFLRPIYQKWLFQDLHIPKNATFKTPVPKNAFLRSRQRKSYFLLWPNCTKI